jgi:ubiquinone/menaquinone biosynthesis C-methylase UbiE/spore maturation protein CgeB
MNADTINDHYYGDLSHPTTQRCRQRIHWICQQAVGQRVLDVGCSQGITCLLLGREGFDCTGVDIEEPAVRRAQQDLEKEEPHVRERVRFLRADAARLPFEDGHFDTVLLCEILEHLTHPQRILLEVRRVLKDGGKLVITVPYGLLAHQDHKRVFYHISLLETLQPWFRTTLLEALHSRQLVYCGLKDNAYDWNQLPKEALLARYLAWENELEERCTSAEWSVIQTHERLGEQLKSLREQLSRLTEDIGQRDKALAAKAEELNLLQAEGVAKDQRIRDLEGVVEQARAADAAWHEQAAKADLLREALVKNFEEITAAKDQHAHELEKSREETRRALAALQEEERRTNEELTRVKTEAAGSATTLVAANHQVAALQTENANLRATLLATEEALLRLRADAEDGAAALSAAREQTQALQAEAIVLRQELAATASSLARLQAETATAGAALTAAQQQGESLQAENLALRSETIAKAESLSRLRAEGATTAAALAAAQQEALSLRGENAGLRQELATQNTLWQQRLSEAEKLHQTRLQEQERRLKLSVTERETDWNRRAANRRVRAVARALLPAGAQVLVISKGDDDVLQLDGRHGWHFPQTAGGVYAGYHPANSADAIAHLEALKAKGAEFLLIPAPSFWWLDYYADFRRHLETYCRLLTYAEDACLIFALRSPPTDPRQPLALCLVGAPTPKPAGGTPTQAPAPAAAPASAAVSTAAPCPPRPRPSAGRLRVGAILDEFTAACFGPECSLVTFRPDNWKTVLEQNPPDLLFVESAWHGNGGSWQYKIASFQKSMGEELVDVVNFCRTREIPTVFWNKEDPPHFERFIRRAPLFDVVFTSDADMIPRYRPVVQHDRVFALPFAAQPKIHHPILDQDRRREVCFAGAYYAADHDERRRDMDLLLRPALRFGLHIYDRQHGLAGVNAKQYQFPVIYQPAIQGRLEYDDMVRAYKWYKVFLNVNSVKQSPTMFSRRVFELLASGTPVISAYAKGIVELLGNDIVHLTTSEQETQAHLETLLQHQDHWARVSLRGIREVLSRHTYAHRLADICRSVGLPSAGVRLPWIRAVARLDSAPQIQPLAAMLARQAYRRFRLLVLVGVKFPKGGLDSLRSALPDIQVEVQPAGRPALEALTQTQEDYLWLIQRDDFYGDCFLLDAALATLYADADVIGKHTHFDAREAQDRLVLQQPGHEFRWSSGSSPGSILARPACLAPKHWTRLAAGQEVLLPKARGLSIDRFNYVRGGAALANASNNGARQLLAEVQA